MTTPAKKKTTRRVVVQTNSGQVSISVSDLSNGVYNISIQFDGKVIETEKIVIK